MKSFPSTSWKRSIYESKNRYSDITEINVSHPNGIHYACFVKIKKRRRVRTRKQYDFLYSAKHKVYFICSVPIKIAFALKKSYQSSFKNRSKACRPLKLFTFVSFQLKTL